MRTLIAAMLLTALLASGCNDRRPPYQIVFHTVSDHKEPMQGVTVEVQGVAGHSDASGTVPFSLMGVEGSELAVRALCPERYRLVEAPHPITLRTVQNPNGEGMLPIEITLRCAPTERQGVVIISLGSAAAGLPVSFDEQPAGVTDASGTIHIPFSAAPSTRFTIKVDTTARPDLVPPNPSMSFAMTDEDTFFRFDRKIESSKPAAPAPRQHTRKKRRSSGGGGGPVRL